MATDYEYEEGTQLSDSTPEIMESATLALLNKSEIDQQITTAKKYPRSIKRFRDECLSMVTLSEDIASECIYALPRDGKTIEGPSARFAEVVASAWGNCRAGARVVGEDSEFVTAQGVFYDLEKNVAITYEVKRRITDRNGRRYKTDMVGVTGNAASSVALRNAILKGVPKAFWNDMYKAARKTAVGDIKSIVDKRASALAEFQKMGATPDMVFQAIGVRGAEDIGVEHLITLKGLFTALRDGDTTFEEAFASRTVANSAAAGEATERRTEQLAKKYAPENPQPATEPLQAESPSPSPAAETSPSRKQGGPALSAKDRVSTSSSTPPEGEPARGLGKGELFKS